MGAKGSWKMVYCFQGAISKRHGATSESRKEQGHMIMQQHACIFTAVGDLFMFLYR